MLSIACWCVSFTFFSSKTAHSAQVPTSSSVVRTASTSASCKTTQSPCASLRSLHTHSRFDTPHTSVFLPASDIPSFVGKGNVDLGITGHDVILEAQMEEHVSETLRLGFGKCALQVQVPEAAPVRDVDALAGKRIVTSFEVLAGRFFADVDQRVGGPPTQIEYVGGSVEAACALGLADGIGARCSFSSSTYTHPRSLSQVDLVGA